MAHIWKKKDNLPLSEKDRLRSGLQPDLDLGWLYFVEVCGFTKQFRPCRRHKPNLASGRKYRE